jgi:peptide/nickel transport system ATP-binding protein
MLVHKLTKSNKEAKDKTIYLLEKVGLSKEHFNRYPHQFSGGQRQRIVIARALAVEPEFIVCDESVSALDVSVQAQILNLLNELKQTFNLTLLFISHDLSVIQYISNRVLVMQKGKIVEEALSKQIFTNPQHYYTQQLLNSVPQIRF